jgi:excisionase family DNA binding protein
MPALHEIDTPAARRLRLEIAQEAFDFLVPRKEWHTPQEMARYSGMELSFIYEAIQQGKICAHGHNAATGSKEHYRIRRDAVIGYLLGSARYEPADFLRHLCDIIDRLGPTSLQLILEHAHRRRAKHGA